MSTEALYLLALAAALCGWCFREVVWWRRAEEVAGSLASLHRSFKEALAQHARLQEAFEPLRWRVHAMRSLVEKIWPKRLHRWEYNSGDPIVRILRGPAMDKSIGPELEHQIRVVEEQRHPVILELRQAMENMKVVGVIELEARCAGFGARSSYRYDTLAMDRTMVPLMDDFPQISHFMAEQVCHILAQRAAKEMKP